MNYYGFDRETGRFTGVFAAQVDPLESKLLGKLTYCGPPQNATAVQPPGDGTDAVWTGSEWRIVEPVVEPELDPVFVPGAVKDECRARVHAVLSEETQRNLVARATVGLLDESQLKSYRAALGWIDAMRLACRSLIAAETAAFGSDEHWPECPDEVVSLANSF